MMLCAAACSDTPASPSPVASGTWGGDHVAMKVSNGGGADLEFDCAHGVIESGLTVDSRGQFDAAGVFIREHGGPIRLGEVPDTHPARYVGTIRGDAMTLTVRLTDGSGAIGTFSLTRGSLGRIVKCL